MTAPYYDDGTVQLWLGPCLEVLRRLPDASVDAVVCDPPYGLAELSTAMVVQALAAWMAGDRDHVPDGRGFMSREWDRFVPPPGAWDECLRVLKPGGHLLAFAAPRTVDLMGLSIRIAGFQIKDSIDWIFGSGFPKSLDVGKAIDKAAGAERAVVGVVPPSAGGGRSTARDGWRRPWMDDEDARAKTRAITAPATEDATRWDGWGTALKPAHEPIVLARKPLAGTVAQTVLAHGTGALNIAGCRVAPTGESRPRVGEASQERRYTEHGGTDLAALPGVRGGSPDGRWPTNVLYSHPPLLDDHGQVIGDACADGCVEGCPVAELDRQSGVGRTNPPGSRSAGGQHGTYSPIGAQSKAEMPYYGDVGGASRFFPVFRYEAKAPAHERPRLPDGTAWPTVKPLALMRWLVRLVTPPGGLVLDPFCGSGTTGEAAVVEGFRAVLIDQDPIAAELTKARLSKPIAPVLDFFEGEIA